MADVGAAWLGANIGHPVFSEINSFAAFENRKNLPLNSGIHTVEVICDAPVGRGEMTIGANESIKVAMDLFECIFFRFRDAEAIIPQGRSEYHPVIGIPSRRFFVSILARGADGAFFSSGNAQYVRKPFALCAF